jgi:hypothetical protein
MSAHREVLLCARCGLSQDVSVFRLGVHVLDGDVQLRFVWDNPP